MKIQHIKQSIKNKESCKGDKNSRTHYKIATTQKDLSRYANRKFNLFLRDNKNSLQIDNNLLKYLQSLWLDKGYTIKQWNSLGTIKALEILKK